MHRQHQGNRRMVGWTCHHPYRWLAMGWERQIACFLWSWLPLMSWYEGPPCRSLLCRHTNQNHMSVMSWRHTMWNHQGEQESTKPTLVDARDSTSYGEVCRVDGWGIVEFVGMVNVGCSHRLYWDIELWVHIVAIIVVVVDVYGWHEVWRPLCRWWGVGWGWDLIVSDCTGLTRHHDVPVVFDSIVSAAREEASDKGPLGSICMARC